MTAMGEKYNESCMKFSNNELKKYLIDNVLKCGGSNLDIRLLSEDGEEIDKNADIKIETIVFDGDAENLFISFYSAQTSIFSFDEEIMFIDEKSKGIYTSSDVEKNVVYEGSLREMTHEEMLQMFADIIICFIDATGISVIQSDISDHKKFEEYKKSPYYDPHMFIVNVEKEHIIGETKVYENITVNY